jgi:hypothetical protein
MSNDAVGMLALLFLALVLIFSSRDSWSK